MVEIKIGMLPEGIVETILNSANPPTPIQTIIKDLEEIYQQQTLE